MLEVTSKSLSDPLLRSIRVLHQELPSYRSIAYHLIREGVARGEWITAWISTHDNVADLLTKPMTSGEKRNGFVKKILQHIFRKE